MSTTLHNRLMTAYEAATHDHLTDEAAATYLADLATLLNLWSDALRCAQQGDEMGTRASVCLACLHAMQTDARKVLDAKSPGASIVRASKISKR